MDAKDKRIVELEALLKATLEEIASLKEQVTESSSTSRTRRQAVHRYRIAARPLLVRTLSMLSRAEWPKEIAKAGLFGPTLISYRFGNQFLRDTLTEYRFYEADDFIA